MDTLQSLWEKRNPEWETRYQKLIETFADYGTGVSQYSSSRAKTFGAGYEVFIIAFFLGLYNNKTRALTEDKTKRKTLGQPIQYWGNSDKPKSGRTPYPKLRNYIFAALIARTDVDLLALDKGEIADRKVVDMLIDKMEQYANWGFAYMSEKLEENPNHYFNDTAFLLEFTKFMKKPDNCQEIEKF